MPPPPPLGLICLFWIAISCAGCAEFNERRDVAIPPRLAAPPAALVAPCARPAPLPDRDLTRAEVATGWARDRAGLATCADRHRDLATYIADRDRRLAE